MNKVTRSSIESLIQQQTGTSVSIYLPTHRHPSPPHIQEDQTRFKNLIREARDKWHAKTDTDNSGVFDALEAKLDNLDFWQQTTEGMAVFISQDRVELYHLPIECEEHVCIGDAYDLTPLYALMTYDQPYYLLALAMHDTKLYHGDMYGLEPVDIEFPTSPEDALNIDEMFNNSNTIRGQEGGAIGNGASAPHGQGDSSEAGREERLQYFRIIDSTIADAKSVDTTCPVLIAGTDSEAGDYRHLSKLPHLIHPYVQGNHTNTPLQELHTLAWPIIQAEVVEKKVTDALEQCNELQGIQKASNDIKDITEAANMGRVDTLLISLIRKTNDSVSDTIKAAVPILTFGADEDNLVSQLAHKVFSQGGRILGSPMEMLPNHATVAAIYRY